MDTKGKRALWALQFADALRYGYTPLFMDETGHTLWTRSRRARSRRGERANAPVYTAPGRRVDAVFTVSPVTGLASPAPRRPATPSPTYGLVHTMVLDGPMNKERFRDYLFDLVRTLDRSYPGHRFFLNVDNLKAHQASTMTEFLLTRGHHYLYLPPYSPMLNPVEYCFSTFKAGTKAEIVARYGEICNTDRLPWGQKTRARAISWCSEVFWNANWHWPF